MWALNHLPWFYCLIFFCSEGSCRFYGDAWERWINCSLEHDGVDTADYLRGFDTERVETTSQTLSIFAGISFEQATRVFACKSFCYNALD